ncbi:NUDIX hydrolase [Patescibacteria group bacterium]|nr:NUDIX hydrolase [Patescibacteria group bacterium]
MAKRTPIKKLSRLVLLNEEQKLLLGRQAKRRLWHMIGGGVEKGESPEAALLREARQEAHVFCSKLEWIHTETIIWPDHIEEIECFRGYAENTHQMRPDYKEIDALGWTTIHNTRHFALTSTTRLLLQNISIISQFV